MRTDSLERGPGDSVLAAVSMNVNELKNTTHWPLEMQRLGNEAVVTPTIIFIVFIVLHFMQINLITID